jgi:uncharacterized protein YndB with AHSA1/START domain
MVANNSSALKVSVVSDLEIVLTREFDAPRDLVFEAFSKPEHVTHWWGRKDSTLPVCEMEFRPGGTWRYVERAADGNEYGFRGEYREIVRPERIVKTFEFDGLPGHISLDTLVFEDLGARTRIVDTSLFDSVEDRDGMVQSGMAEGAAELYDRLADYLRSMR